MSPLGADMQNDVPWTKVSAPGPAEPALFPTSLSAIPGFSRSAHRLCQTISPKTREDHPPPQEVRRRFASTRRPSPAVTVGQCHAGRGHRMMPRVARVAKW
ncbi:hypothetical protein GCM10009712_43140 [Pseudarthrobacter sulfonivorans]